jgi:phage FluMu protein gp41
VSGGRLTERDITEIVQELSELRWTGLLQIERAGHRIGVTEEGRLVFASSSNPDHRLGPVLLRQGAITLRQMVDAGRALAPGKRFGTILIEAGVLQPKDLVKAVVDQTRDIILHAFTWGDGEFQLEEGAAPSESITLNISTPQLILDGISRIEAWGRVEKGCGGLESSWAPTDTEALLRGLPLSTEQIALLGAIEGVRDLETLCKESPLTDFEVCRTMWAFRVIGLARRLDAAAPLDEDGLEYIMPAEE